MLAACSPLPTEVTNISVHTYPEQLTSSEPSILQLALGARTSAAHYRLSPASSMAAVLTLALTTSLFFFVIGSSKLAQIRGLP